MRTLPPSDRTFAPIRRACAGVLAVVLAVAVATSGMPATAESRRSPAPFVAIHDDETVYVVADASGTPRETVVVSWLRLDGTATVDVLDPGRVQAAEALEDDLEPHIGPEGVTWTIAVDGRRDFFYRADTRAELPIRVRATYFLDGVEVKPEDLAGADGHLRIEVTVENTLSITEEIAYADPSGEMRTRRHEYWVPMLAPVMIELDGRLFTDIRSNAQIVNVSGSTVSHTFMAFPQPDETVSIEMTGRDIAIKPIVVSVYPMMAGSPGFSAAEQLAELQTGLEGLSRLSEGHGQTLGAMVSAMDPGQFQNVEHAAAGLGQLSRGVGELGLGLNQITRLLDGQIHFLSGMTDRLDSEALAETARMPAAIGEATANVRGIRANVDSLIALLDGQIAFLDAIARSNAALKAEARALAEESSTETTTSAAAALVAGLSSQSHMIAALRDGNTSLGMPLGLTDTRESLGELSDGLGAVAEGLETLAEQSAPLSMLPARLREIESALMTLRDGGALPDSSYLPGLHTTRDGLLQSARGLDAIESGLATAGSSLSQLAELPGMLSDMRDTLRALHQGGKLRGRFMPGVATTSRSLGVISREIESGIADSNFGKALTKRMEEQAAAYDTFLGVPEGATGSVRFVFKLDEIGAHAEEQNGAR